MRLNTLDYEIINNSENLIGYSNNMIKLYKEYAKQLIDDMQCDVTCSDLKSELDNVIDLLYNIYENSNGWYQPQLIKVYCHPMGSYQFSILKECD